MARTIIEAVEVNDPAQAAQGVVSSVNSLRTAGFVIPSWDDLIREKPNHGSVEEEDPSQPPSGRQIDAAAAVHKVFLEKEVRPSWMSQRNFCVLWRPLSRLNLSASSFSAVFALLFPSLHVGAGVAVHSIAVVTTGLRVRGLESQATVVTRWSP